jgi:hypothetical protein
LVAIGLGDTPELIDNSEGDERQVSRDRAAETAEVQLPDGIIRTNSRLARMAAQGRAQANSRDAPDNTETESSDPDNQ